MPGRPVGSSRVAPTGSKSSGRKLRVDVGVGDVAAQRRQRVVQRELVERLVGGGQAAVVAGRQDVVGAVRRRRARPAGLPAGRRADRRTHGHGDHHESDEVTRSDAHRLPPRIASFAPCALGALAWHDVAEPSTRRDVGR